MGLARSVEEVPVGWLLTSACRPRSRAWLSDDVPACRGLAGAARTCARCQHRDKCAAPPVRDGKALARPARCPRPPARHEPRPSCAHNLPRPGGPLITAIPGPGPQAPAPDPLGEQIRRFYVRALTIDRPRSVTAGVLRPGFAASSSRVGRPVAASADSAESLRGRLPGREAYLAGPAGDSAVADLAARDRKMGNGHGEAAGTWITQQVS
jgi:hypothetical protein